MRIAVFQMTSMVADVGANLARIGEAAASAAAAGAELLVAPELSLSGYGAGDALRASADPPNGPRRRALAAIARQHGPAIITGFVEAADDGIYNSALFTDGEREVVYRKSHLFGDYEHDRFRAGAPEVVMVDHRGLKLGLLVCYDVEFPENLRPLARAGADVIIVPTALAADAATDFVARRMIRVRAFENQLFVAYAGACGTDAFATYRGMSQVVAPDGEILAMAGAEETLLICDIDPARVTAVRAKQSYLDDLRR